jgi:hypothetical protein
MKIARTSVAAAFLLGSAVVQHSPSALAEAPDGAIATAPSATIPDRATLRRELREITVPGPYFDLFATFMFGDGLRFNNPYRLAHELGGSAQSLSTTAPYFDLGFGATMGKPDGLQHGARLGLSLALGGVPQQVITPAYQAIMRFGPAWLVYGWAGLPIILSPDTNVGAEIAAGGAWFARAGLGVTAAFIADGFYGAGTRERSAVLYPVLSAQIGLLVAYEVLP